jgi:hypothetical protein
VRSSSRTVEPRDVAAATGGGTVTDDRYTAEERRWLVVWDEKLGQVADGTMRPDEVSEWVWRKKVLNAINVTIQRIKRSERPGRDPRRNDNTWVTVAAERARGTEELSHLARQVLTYIVDRLAERGHEFDVDQMATSSGIVVVSINVKALRRFMSGAAAASAGNPAATAEPQ